jgi:hypothetical protein
MSTDRTENSFSIVACIRFHGNLFTQLFYSNTAVRATSRVVTIPVLCRAAIT